MKVAKIEGRDDFVKDINSGAVLNAKPTALQAARARKSRVIDQTDQINNLEERMDRIEFLLRRILKEDVNG